MGTLQEQQRDFEGAVVYMENLRTSDGPYKMSEEQKRQFKALLRHSTHGAFRAAPQSAKEDMNTREKQTWEALGNITKVEAMRRFTTKTNELKPMVDLAIQNSKLS